MAIVRDINTTDNFQTYIATVAFFCAISCTILMLKFRGFRASLNLSSGKSSGSEHFEFAPHVSCSGAYRTSRDEYYGTVSHTDHRKIITPSMVKLPPNAHIKPSKSSGDLSKTREETTELHKSTPNVAIHPSSANQNAKQTKQQLKEQKRIEKERLAEQKKRDKLATQEREKQEKLRKQRDKQAALQQAKELKKEKQKKTKPAAPQPKQAAVVTEDAFPPPQIKVVVPQQNAASSKQTRAPPPPQFPTMGQASQNPLSQRPGQYSTNTLDSSISRSSGPPPYSDTPEVVLRSKEKTGDTTFVKPVEASSSWDLISQHRQQISRTNAAASKPKKLDLQYNVGNISSEDKDNSEA